MTTRMSKSTVTFNHPFRLAALDEVVAAGTYTVETEEELIEGLSFAAYRRTSNVMLVPRHGLIQIQVVPVDPAEIEAALLDDARTE